MFNRAGKGRRRSGIKIPKFKIEGVEDAYTYYVLILQIPEHVFWDMELSELLTIVADKVAYDNWYNYAREKQREKDRRR